LTGEDSSIENHFNILSGWYHEYYSLNKSPEYKRNSNLFIYIVGHGGDEYMKVLYKDILFSKHVSLFLEDI
jgi:glycosylphosphatidylinositol transamidase (GPIT) subunit GPI8